MNEYEKLDLAIDFLNEGIIKEEYLHEGIFQKLKDLFNKKKKPKIEDPTSGKSKLTEEERMKAYNESIKIAKKVLQRFKTEHKEWARYNKCFEIASPSSNLDFEDFKKGEIKFADIIYYDLWNVEGGDARNKFDSVDTGDSWAWIMDQLQDEILEKVEKVMSVEYWGDWDEGPIEIITK